MLFPHSFSLLSFSRALAPFFLSLFCFCYRMVEVCSNIRTVRGCACAALTAHFFRGFIKKEMNCQHEVIMLF